MTTTVFDTAFYPGLEKAQSIGDAWGVYIGGPAFGGSGWDTAAVAELRKVAKTVPIFVPAQSGLSAQRASDDSPLILQALGAYVYSACAVVIDLENGAVLNDLPGAAAYVSALRPLLNQAGFRFVLYTSRAAMTSLQPLLSDSPDAVWLAEWQFTSVQSVDPHSIPGFPNDAYSLPGQRAWQYAGVVGGIATTMNGVDIDISAFDDSLLVAPTVSPAPAEPAPVPAPVPHPASYEVAAGDTLWAIEDRFALEHGSLYRDNAVYLDRNAQARGFQSSEQGRLIWPGEVLQIP